MAGILDGLADYFSSGRQAYMGDVREVEHRLRKLRNTARNKSIQAREERDQIFHELDEIQHELFQLNMMNEAFLRVLKTHLGITDEVFESAMDEVVKEHQERERREDEKAREAQEAHADEELVSESPGKLEHLAMVMDGENIQDEAGDMEVREPREPKLQSRDTMNCPHCNFGLDDYSETCPWCYGEIRWM